MRIKIEDKTHGKMLIDKNIAIWTAPSTSNGVSYTVAERIAGELSYKTVPGKIAGHVLSMEDALSLAMGDSVHKYKNPLHKRVFKKGDNGSTECVIAPLGVVETIRRDDGKVYKKAEVQLAVALPIYEKKNIVAFKCDGEVFQREQQLEGFTAYLDAQDCCRLKEYGIIQKGPYKIHHGESAHQVVESAIQEVDEPVIKAQESIEPVISEGVAVLRGSIEPLKQMAQSQDDNNTEAQSVPATRKVAM